MDQDSRVGWLEQALLRRGLLDDARLAQVHDFRERRKIKFFSALTAGGFVDEHVLARVTSEELGVPMATAGELAKPDSDALKRLAPEKARKDAVLPLKVEGRKLFVALSDPFDVVARFEIQSGTGLRLEVRVAAKTDLLRAIEAAYPPSRTDPSPPAPPEKDRDAEFLRLLDLPDDNDEKGNKDQGPT